MLEGLASSRSAWRFKPTHVADLIIVLTSLFVVGFFQPQFEVRFDYLTDLDIDIAAQQSAATNIFNQIKWLATALLATALVRNDPQRLMAFASLCWPLIAMVAVALASTLWSVEPAVTLRRSIRFLLPVYTLIIAFAYVESPRRALALVHLSLTALLLLNLVALAIPKTFNIVGEFTGSFNHKNTLGLIAGMALLVGAGANIWLRSTLLRRLNWLYLLAWFGLLVLSASKTSFGLIVIAPTLLVCLAVASRILRISIGVICLTLLIAIAIALTLPLATLGMTPRDLLDMIAEGITFTGRTQIWEFMLEKIEEKWVLGYGFGAFWGTGANSPNLTARYQYMWYLQSAHNGYLDIIANVGVLGLLALAFNISHFSMCADRIRRQEPYVFYLFWVFIIFVLLHNMLESSIYRLETPLWYLFLMATLLTPRLLVDQRRARAEAAGPSGVMPPSGQRAVATDR